MFHINKTNCVPSDAIQVTALQLEAFSLCLKRHAAMFQQQQGMHMPTQSCHSVVTKKYQISR